MPRIATLIRSGLTIAMRKHRYTDRKMPWLPMASTLTVKRCFLIMAAIFAPLVSDGRAQKWLRPPISWPLAENGAGARAGGQGKAPTPSSPAHPCFFSRLTGRRSARRGKEASFPLLPSAQGRLCRRSARRGKEGSFPLLPNALLAGDCDRPGGEKKRSQNLLR